MRKSIFFLAPLVLGLCTSVLGQQQPSTSASGIAAPATQPTGSPMTPVATPDPDNVELPAAPETNTQPAMQAQAIIKGTVPPPALPPQKILMRRIAMIDVPGRPGFNGVAMVGGNLVMTHPAADTVDVFNLAKRRVIATVKEMKGASGIAVDEKSGKAYVANSDANEIAVISTKDWSVERTIPLKASPSELLLVPELNLLLTSNWRDLSVSEVDLGTGSAGNTAVLDGRTGCLAYDPQNRQIFVSLEDQNEIAVLDPSLKLVKRIPLVASQPTGLAFDGASRRVFVSVRSAVIALDADSGNEINRVAAPEGVDALWFERGNGKLYAAAGGSVLVMNTKGRLEVDREWPTAVKGHVVAFDPAKNMLYLPGGFEGRSKLLILRSLDKDAQEAMQRGLQKTVGPTVASK